MNRKITTKGTAGFSLHLVARTVHGTIWLYFHVLLSRLADLLTRLIPNHAIHVPVPVRLINLSVDRLDAALFLSLHTSSTTNHDPMINRSTGDPISREH